MAGPNLQQIDDNPLQIYRREQIQKVENTQEGRFWKKMVHRRGAREGDPLPPDTKTRQDKKTPQSKHSFERELNKFKDEVALFYKNKKNN